MKLFHWTFKFEITVQLRYLTLISGFTNLYKSLVWKKKKDFLSHKKSIIKGNHFVTDIIWLFVFQVAYLLFLILFSYIVLFNFKAEISEWEILLVFWVFTLFLEEFRQVCLFVCLFVCFIIFICLFIFFKWLIVKHNIMKIWSSKNNSYVDVAWDSYKLR